MALLLLLGLTVWGSYRDMQFLRATVLEVEIGRLRSHAQRTVGRIEQDLELRTATDLVDLDHDSWLQRHWQRVIPPEERRVYAAVVDPDGRLVMHSDPTHHGKRLPRSWYNRVMFELGEDVVETRSPILALGELAYDVRVPIEVEGREIGEYHAGFDVGWFEEQFAATQASFVWRRLFMIGGVLLVVLLATTSLYAIASHSIALRRAVDAAAIQRAAEVGTLAAGLAHEIRNPLQAIQINLHALRRVHERKAELPEEEMTRMLDQSSREIARIEQLMQQLTGFATPDEPRDEVVNLTTEISDVVDFIRQEMLDQHIDAATRLPNHPVWVRMDRGRLRQIMLNLLRNAQQAMTEGGRIDVELGHRRGRVELTVADDGPGIADEYRQRIFEPFFSTRSDGTGLGLALVKRFIDEVGGRVCCEPNPHGGTTIRVVLPESSPPEQT